MFDNNSALTDELNEQMKDDLHSDEDHYRPLTEMYDRVIKVRPANQSHAAWLEDRARVASKSLTTKLRQKFRGLENTGVTYGRRGKRLSGRHLTQTVTEIRSDRQPTRPFRLKGQAVDTSIAVDIVLDQSGSMAYEINDVASGLFAIAKAMDSIGASTSIHGFADGRYIYDVRNGGGCHRDYGVDHFVYKTFKENFTTKVKNRFGNIKVGGCTPLADGIQYGLNLLSERREAHRVMFILTDGAPTGGEGVIRRQNRLAEEAGIKMIAVGIGGFSESSKYFENHVTTYSLNTLAPALISKIDEVVDTMGGSKRGRRVRK